MQRATVLLFGFSVASGALEASPRVRDYTIAANFTPADAWISAEATVRFASSRCEEPKLVFFLHGELETQLIRFGDQTVSFEQESVFYDFDYSLVANRVEVDCPETGLERGMTILYAGAFHPSRARSSSDYMRVGQDGVFLRGYGYSLWFPVFLEAGEDSYRTSFSRVVLSTPPELVTVFTGTRIRDAIVEGRRVSEWTAPDADLFDAQCTAARLREESSGEIHLYFREDAASIEAEARMAELSRRLLAFFGEHYRNSPATTELHLVEMPRYGNIASGNVVGIDSDDWRRFDASSGTGRLLAHELVHAHVNVPVSREDPLYAFAVEGFPSYFHLPALAELLGEDAYREFLARREEEYISKRATGVDRAGRPLPPEKPLLEIAADEVGVYKDVFVLSDRALLFFDALRRRLGAERFLQFAKRVVTRDRLTAAGFRALVLDELPGFADELTLWLETNEYPSRWRLDYR